MLKIRALNRESSSDEDVPVIRREAQEEIVLELYNKALRLQAEEQYSESKLVLEQLLKENIPLLENNGGLPKSMQTLKYSCQVNIGNIFLKLNEVNQALDTFLIASELDSTDVTLWYKIGKLSLKVDKFRQSAYAFSKGLECSESHWPCLDQLISILFAIKDTVTCLLYIGKALMLDSEYIKGHVLRRQIYLDNPATREYYQLYNPDHIWEPEESDIDEDEAKEYLEEVQNLCERVTEVEKSFGPKPLQTIPLPKPLEEYTWLSLAKTVIYLHQYITDQGMSHFTFIDMKNCMSQTSEKIASEDSETKCIEEKSAEGKSEGQIVEEKMQVDATPERRQSVNSEANNECRDITPIQTDNDEEQNMDQDNEEPEEPSESKAERGRPKGSKRKRDLLSDLQIWGWHSKRKQSKKAKEKDFTVEDALNRIVPKTLLPNKIEQTEKLIQAEESMNTMDIYNLYMEENQLSYLSPIHSPASVNLESYFGTDREKDEVLEFWTRKRERIDAVVLIKELIFSLSKLWYYKWPKDLIALYIQGYGMFREHYDPPQLFCGDETFEQIRNDALATILYGELFIFSMEMKENLNPTILGYLQIVSTWQDQWQEEFGSFFIRVCWLRSHLFRKDNSNDLAIRALQVIQDTIDEEEAKSREKFLLSLPNCLKHGLITRQIIEKILKHLDLIDALGTVENLYNSEKYAEVAEIIKPTFKHSRHHPQVGKLGRPAQIGLLLHSLWFTDLIDCFIWCEECIFEALDNFLKPGKESYKWEKLVEKCLAIFHEIIKKETVNVIDYLTEEKRIRLVETLSKIICKQMNTESMLSLPLGCVTPWILLHYVLVRDEQRQYANKRISQGKRDKTEIIEIQENIDDELPASVSILFSAHEFLGPKGWCLTGEGEMLHFILDTVLDRLDTPIFERLREKIDIHIEQALFCLYQHPSKKNKISRHLADHNVDPLSLTWERSFQLFEFYGPSSLPEFNSYKNASISADLEQLFKRIIALVPQSCSPQQHLPKIMDYIHGKSEKCPDAIEFPTKVRSIFYLIGDFYFKQREFNNCIKYFQMDLCINPLRVDSWACLGLSYSAQLETKLNHCKKFKSETEFLDKAKYSSICFKKALEISPDPLILWIEYGTFQYTVHSYCSRILKYESENLSMEKFEFLENQKNIYLDNAENSFEKAIALYEKDDSGEPDERWLQYYILGKIAEKKQKEPTEYLQYYMTASNLLDENEATYPEKINYSNPQHLSVEALELHYRKYASVLKYLELNEGKPIPNSLGEFFKKCLDSSKFLLKPVQKPPAAPPAEKPPETLPPPPPPAPPSLGFQEQFLNSLTKLNESDVGLPIAEEIEEKSEKQSVPTSETAVKKEEKMDVELQNEQKEVNKKEETLNDTEDKGTANESASVIMISDSEDEGNKKLLNKEEGNIKAKIISEEQETKPVKMEEIKDVQQMLDEMMVETMKETERQGEVDSDLSGTEKVEEVVVKDENETKASKVEGDKEKTKSVKRSDSETDTDNRKTSADDSNSSSSSSESSSESSDSESDEDDSSSSSSSSSSEVDSENLTNNEISQLIDKCVTGLEICITRLTQNYKALYRLAHLYFNYKAKKDLTKCKQLLLNEYKCRDGTTVSGLFSDRKANNFFNGIWRIPSTEIDRPGSLCAHMSRCISLLLNVLTTTNDTKTLIDLCLNLRKTPEPDKIYIKDSDRIVLSEQALTMCTQCLRSQIKSMTDMTNPQIVKLLQEIYRVYQRLQKHVSSKETAFGTMLIEVYRKFIKEKIPENVNVLELATKFCMQHKAVEKPKPPPVVNLTPPLPRGPGIAAPPVLPSPSSINTSPMPLKRPGSGRPRGRPPLPKIPGQIRPPRASKTVPNMNKSYAWQKSLFDQSYAYEYLKHYQDELIKQYSQNLNLNQLTQLSQLLSQGQIHNPATATAITNQFLSQTGLLNTTNLVKQLNPSGSMTQASAAQLVESLKQLSPSLKKKLGVDQVLSNLTGMPSTMTNRPSIAQTTVSSPSITSSGKIIPSPSIKQVATASSTMTPLSFKGSGSTKQPPMEGPTSKNLMKDRPNLSITPVATNIPLPTTTTTSFIKPTIAPSGGKTLQEKLAEKKKEQQNKQLKHMSVQHENQQSEALKRSLNLPNIPSSLTLSKSIPITSSAPITSILPVTRTSIDMPQSLPSLLKSSNASSKYPLEISSSAKPLTLPSKSQEPVLPSPLILPKSGIPLPTPKFPADSGISISQVPVNKPKKPEEPSRERLSPIEVSQIRSSSSKSVHQDVVKKLKKHNKQIRIEKVKTSPGKVSKPSSSHPMKNLQDKISDRKQNKIDLNQNVSLHRLSGVPAKKSAPSKDDDDVICID